MPQLRAGSPVLTDRGEQVARRWAWWLGPVIRLVVRWSRPVVRAARKAAHPLLTAVRPRVAPLTEAISRAVEEGSAPTSVRPRAGSATGAISGDGAGATSGDADDVLRLAATLRAPRYRLGDDVPDRPETTPEAPLARR